MLPPSEAKGCAGRYLNHLLPLLRTTLVDPIPDVRATAAKAFGTLCKGLPEGAVENLVPELVDLLCARSHACVPPRKRMCGNRWVLATEA